MISEQLSVGAGAAVDVRIKSGRLDVKEGPEGAVTVEVDTDDPRLTVEQTGDRVYITSDAASGWLSSRPAKVLVFAPAGADISAETSSASVNCEGRMGDLDVKTGTGDVTLERVESATVKTASGDVRAARVERDINVACVTGDARVDSCGRGVFSAASGDVRIGTAAASVIVSTVAGDLDIGLFLGRRASVKSMSGSVGIGAPAGTKLDLDATLLSGKLRLPAPRPTEGAAARQMKIKAKLVSGDLTIRRVEDERKAEDR